MPTFQLSILSPRGKIFEDEVDSLSAPGLAGGFGVLHGHAPMIAAVQAGVTVVHREGKAVYFYTGEGVVEVSHHHVAMLVDVAETAETLEAGKSLVQQRRELLATSKTVVKDF